LGLGVHDERAVPRHWLPDRPAAEDDDLEGRVGRVLTLVRGDLQMVTRAEDDQLAAGNGTAVGSSAAGAGEHVDQRVEVLAPGQLEARAGCDRGMDERDGGVCRARARVTTHLT